MLKAPTLIVCRQCNRPFSPLDIDIRTIAVTTIPKDWSFVQIGSSFTYDSQDATIVGRVRLQLQNDYKNFWCAKIRNGEHIWLVESFASFAVLQPEWKTLNESRRKLHAGSTLKLSERMNLKGEFVEKCEAVGFEGQVGTWELFESGFFISQAAASNGDIAIFMVHVKTIRYLAGRKIDVEKLSLKNILVWNEWK